MKETRILGTLLASVHRGPQSNAAVGAGEGTSLVSPLGQSLPPLQRARGSQTGPAGQAAVVPGLPPCGQKAQWELRPV